MKIRGIKFNRNRYHESFNWRKREFFGNVTVYAYYYSFRILYYNDINKWILETSYAAYGGKDKDWIENYGENWDFDLANYFN